MSGGMWSARGTVEGALRGEVWYRPTGNNAKCPMDVFRLRPPRHPFTPRSDGTGQRRSAPNCKDSASPSQRESRSRRSSSIRHPFNS
jgi:hypothetical protein